MKERTLAFLVLCMIALPSCDSHREAAAEFRAVEATNADLVLSPVSELPEQRILDILIEILVVDAEAADPDDWPASFFSKSSAEKCTSTLVGDQVLLTAAHCVPDGGSVFVPNLNAEGVCTHAPDFKDNKSADWALCLMKDPIPKIPYERINDRADALKKGNTLLLTGFGCHKASGATDNKYRIGKAEIEELPTGNVHFIKMRGGAVVCFGDSGGPAFLLSNDATGPRRVAAVNAARVPTEGVSQLASVTTQSARDFLDEWTNEHGVAICGFTPAAQGCRQ